MIFGKSNKQQFKETQEYLEKWYMKRQKVFAFFPVGLVSGQVVWLGYVWKDLNIIKGLSGLYYQSECTPNYYINKIDK